MRTLQRHSRNDRDLSLVDDHEPVDALGVDGDADEAFDDAQEIFRVRCPECARPIALVADEEVLPRHAVCATPWNPFGLTVCPGSGRAVHEAAPEGGPEQADEDMAVLLTLPAGLNWRTQPFSHVGGPGSRPIQAPRRAA